MSPRKQMSYSSHPNRAARSAHAKAAKQFQTYDTSYIRPKANYRPMVILIIALVVILIVIIGVVRGCTMGSSRPLADVGQEVTIVIEEGATASSIGSLLEENGLVARAGEFTDEVNRAGAGSDLKPGTYTFAGGTSTSELVTQIAAGPLNETVSVPEGKTARATADLVEAATDGRITADEFMGRVNNASDYQADYDFLSEVYDNSLEGFLFPKTYEIAKEDTADSLVRKMLDQFKVEVGMLDYSFAESKNLTPYDVLILASVIERESAADVRPEVSSVFYNRMSGGMQLQSDATIAYLVDGDPTPEDIDMTAESPYNTYYNYGLPPGPICSPSFESLEAACHPADTNYLYFFFEPDENGEMQYYFSVDYEEHLNAVAGLGQAINIGDRSTSTAASAEGEGAAPAEGEAAPAEGEGAAPAEGEAAPAEGEAVEAAPAEGDGGGE